MRDRCLRWWLAILALQPLWTARADQPKPPKSDAAEKQAGAVKALPGFVQVQVLGVMDTQGSKAVILKEAESGTLLPIWIGEAEAFSIQLRIDRQRFQRPLTHDLMDRMMRELGGELVKVQVDDLRNNTFLGTITMRQGKRVFSLDARPSDSIALAIGNQTPIFVSRQVLESAGIKQDEQKPEEEPAPEGDQPQPPPGDEEKTI